MSHDNIHYAVEDRIATITIDRPERRNAMTHAMNAEYARLIRKAGDDDAVQVLVVTGAGGAFCAGTDLSDFDTQTTEERSGNAADHTPGIGWWALAGCPKPTVCAVDGPAVGMGAEFTSHADIRILSTPSAHILALRPARAGSRHRRGNLAAAAPHRHSPGSRTAFHRAVPAPRRSEGDRLRA